VKKRGNVFIIIICILGIIFTLATYLLKSTVEEKGATEFTRQGIQTQSLAEAALERAVGVLADQLNDPNEWKNENSFGFKLRQPMNVTSEFAEGLSDKLGKDELLKIENIGELILNKDTLQKPDKKGKERKELDEVFKLFVGENPDAKYELEVKMKLDKAFRIAPGPSVEGNKYKVPGVDCIWNCHSGVKEFLNGNGFLAFEMRLSDNFKWLSFKIPGIKYDQTDFIVKNLCPGLGDIIYLNKILENLFPNFYPYKITFERGIFPPITDKIAKDLSATLSQTNVVEKFGFLAIESKATITFPDHRSMSRTIAAVKEFKCADIEPIAPMYSFFASNLKDNVLVFSPDDSLKGGNLYVNNFTGFSAVKDGPPKGAEEKREFPGLVRVDGTKPMICDTSFIGNPGDPDLDENDNFFKKMGRGAELLLTMNIGLNMFRITTGKTVAYKMASLSPKGSGTVPDSAKGSGSTSQPSTGGVSESDNNTGKADEFNAQNAGKKAGIGGIPFDIGSAMKGLLPSLRRPNFMPPVNAMDWGITIYQIFTHLIPEFDAWARWEWPNMGRGLRTSQGEQFTLPLPGYISGVTHFFGGGALAPTLTREVEGYLLKRYKQWHFGFVAFPPGIPWPSGNVIYIPTVPPICLIPFPIPLWHTHDCINKYEYNFYLIKPPKDLAGNVDEEIRVYDPQYMENSPPNLYSIEQYAKKSSYYYPTAEDFYKDIPNRLIKVKTKSGDKECLKLNGVTFIANSIQLPPPEWKEKSLLVSGSGMIVAGGNCFLRGSIEDAYTDEEERQPETPRTVFSLILRKGGLIYDEGEARAKIEGCVYTDRGIAIVSGKALKIVGNWVTNSFIKATAAPNSLVVVDYTAYKTRSSLNSLHPEKGKFDPERYHVSLAPGWESWKIK